MSELEHNTQICGSDRIWLTDMRSMIRNILIRLKAIASDYWDVKEVVDKLTSDANDIPDSQVQVSYVLLMSLRKRTLPTPCQAQQYPFLSCREPTTFRRC